MFDVGQIITFGDPDSDNRITAVVVATGERSPNLFRVVVLDGEIGVRLAEASAYTMNRGWFVYDYADLALLDDPTDDQIATAMHILLTGYVPGIDL